MPLMVRIFSTVISKSDSFSTGMSQNSIWVFVSSLLCKIYQSRKFFTLQTITIIFDTNLGKFMSCKVLCYITIAKFEKGISTGRKSTHFENESVIKNKYFSKKWTCLINRNYHSWIFYTFPKMSSCWGWYVLIYLTLST